MTDPLVTTTRKLPAGVDFEIIDNGFSTTTIEFFPLTRAGCDFLSVDESVYSLTILRSVAYARLDKASENGIGWRIKNT